MWHNTLKRKRNNCIWGHLTVGWWEKTSTWQGLLLGLPPLCALQILRLWLQRCLRSRTSLVGAHISQCVPQIVTMRLRVGAAQSRWWPRADMWTLSQVAQLASEENLRVGRLPPLWSTADPSARMWRRSGSVETSGTDMDERRIRAEHCLLPCQGASNGSPLTEEAFVLFQFGGRKSW